MPKGVLGGIVGGTNSFLKSIINKLALYGLSQFQSRVTQKLKYPAQSNLDIML